MQTLYGGHFVDNGERSWTACLCLRLVSSKLKTCGLGLLQQNRIKFQSSFAQKAVFFFCEPSSLLCKCCNVCEVSAPVEKQKMPQFLSEVDCIWNAMAHAQKPDFTFRQNRWVHLNWQGRQFSLLLTAEVCASAVVILDTPCSEVVWRVLATHSIR
jgi:hypothetical protein